MRLSELFEKQILADQVITILEHKFTSEERLEIMSHFCGSCGDKQDPEHQCQCWNDE